MHGVNSITHLALLTIPVRSIKEKHNGINITVMAFYPAVFYAEKFCRSTTIFPADNIPDTGGQNRHPLFVARTLPAINFRFQVHEPS